MAWRFSARPMDLPERPEGSYIRFTVGGRDVPTYVVRRSPTQNWGFIAESCWGVYTSFRMPLRAKTQSPLRFRPRQWLSGLQNNNNNNHNNDDQEENNDNNNSNSNNDHNPGETDQPLTPQLQHQRNVRVTPLLADDSSFIITNEVQWREALLYNFGATVLPEGESASEDFDRMFGQTLHDRQL
uniref:Uncharacterized protein n=1 Tax=Cyclophora tenuis TaxID=216820 RepID=A0A6U1QAQ3_CYCTE|mmetsp:Transcript_17920/g.30504  ORF Transcript_17920/g.30504 Transcript_17920/m.30504 type:complete len:184 (+) Transcript_17920:167-718(+)